MANEYSTIDCHEIADTLRESYDDINGVSASVQLRTDWNNRWSLIEDIMVNNRRYPKYTGAIRPEPQTAQIAPLACDDSSGQEVSYDEAIVTINYSNLTENQVAESIEPVEEFQKLDYRWFRWDNNNGSPLIEGQAPSKQYLGLNLRRVLYRQPLIPSNLLSLIGSCNQAAYFSSILGLTFAAETLMLKPPTTQRVVTTGGSEGWTLNLAFRFKHHGWNTFWNENAQAYQKVYIADGAQYIQAPLANFSNFLS